jgi:SAM-dependent methyltransferase
VPAPPIRRTPPPRSGLWSSGGDTHTPVRAGGADDLPERGLRRSVALLKAFRTEESDPAGFYPLLARDSVRQLRRYTPLNGKLVLDVGGGPGYFADEFGAAGARYLAIEYDAGEMSLHGREPVAGVSIQGSGLELPVKDASVDVCYSSNVLEHVPRPWQMGSEMIRVTRPGGLVYLSFTTWYSPWGGHETAPWHYLGGRYARRRYESRHGRPPKNVFGESMYAVLVRDAMAWANRLANADLVDALPRYHPEWAKALVRVPGLREVATWNLVLVLRRR